MMSKKTNRHSPITTSRCFISLIGIMLTLHNILRTRSCLGFLTSKTTITTTTTTCTIHNHSFISSLSSQRLSKNSRCYHQTITLFNNCHNFVITDKENNNTNDTNIPKQIISTLAQNKNNHTWKRLSNIINLSLSSSNNNNENNNRRHPRTIADIGCDHGLLAIALATSGHFQKVIGVDVSPLALNNAFTFHNEIIDFLSSKNQHNQEEEESHDDNHESIHGLLSSTIDNDNKHYDYKLSLPLEFRLGNGLEPLQPGEADAICIAGMGVDSMLSILNHQKIITPSQDEDINKNNMNINNDNHMNILDYLQCQHLYLQLPNSRPKFLMMLYLNLQENGWLLEDEQICVLKNRWYITCAFTKCLSKKAVDNHRYTLPGYYLARSNDEDQFNDFNDYIHHHLTWMDGELKLSLTEQEIIWRDTFVKYCQR